jgi:hypothetical protein
MSPQHRIFVNKLIWVLVPVAIHESLELGSSNDLLALFHQVLEVGLEFAGPERLEDLF